MALHKEIYDFFKEEEQPKRARRTRDEMEPPSSKKRPRPEVNPEALKSSFKDGSVHEIVFNNTTKGVTQKAYSIYRKITEEEYNTLKVKLSPKVSTLIQPSSENEHYRDVYYITIPKVFYGARKGAQYTYFIYLTDDVVKSLTSEQKDKIKLSLVPISDIANGLDKRPLDLFTLSSFLSDEKKKKYRVPKQVVSTKAKEDPIDIDLGFLADDEFEPEKDTPEEEPENLKKAKQQAAVFMLDDKVERMFTQIIKNYDITATPSTPEKEKKQAKDTLSDLLKRFMMSLFDMNKDELERKAVIDYSVAKKLEKKPGLYKIIQTSYDNMESIKESYLREDTQIKDEETYKVSVKYGDGKSKDGAMSGKGLKNLIKTDKFVYNQDIPFEKTVDDPRRGMQSIKGFIKILVPPGKERKLTLIGRRTPEGDPIMYDPSSKEPEKKDDGIKYKTFSTSVSGQGARSYKVPVNMGIKMVDVKPSQLSYKYYIIDTDSKEMVHGSNDWKETKEKAASLGDKFKAVQKSALPALGVKVNEELSDKDKKETVSKAVSFKIESDPNDSDSVAEVKGVVKNASFNKDKKELVLTLDNGSQAMFTSTKSGNVTGIYNPDPNDKLGNVHKINDIQSPLKELLDKVFPAPVAESKLEAYIRKRVQQAIKEAEVSQYWGYQGPDVKKKRLEEYMKKYEWGFQNSEDPYVRANGSEKHAIVSKLVHELGDEGVAIFNSYAPKGQEIARPDDLNDMADTPLGSQLHQPYDPNSLTARGGRVAEDAKYDSLYNQAKRDVENKYKNIEDLAVGYNKKDIEIQKSPTLKKNIEKLISQEYGKDASKASPELRKAFMSISDEDLKSSI